MMITRTICHLTQSKATLVLATAALAVALALTNPAAAQFTPTFSVDFQGPTAGFIPGSYTGLPDTFSGVPIDESQILTPFPPGPLGPNPPALGPLPPPGLMVDGNVGSPFGTAPGGLGILPGFAGGVELDALSYGRDVGKDLFFSVDEHAGGDFVLGPAFPNVFTEGPLGSPVGEASADVFRYLGPAVVTPVVGPAVGPGNVDVIDGDGLFPFGGPGLGLIEPNPPSPGGTDFGDNLDAVDVNTTLNDVFGPIYFSLDSHFPDPLDGPPANTGTALGNGVVGGEVLVSFAGGFPGLYAPAPVLGLDFFGTDTDDLDALALFDNGDGVFTPGVDSILFSVRRGSAVIGTPDSAFGIPIEEGDVLTIPVAGGIFPSIFITAESLGLATLRSGTAINFPFGDELDALDLVPEPGTFALSAVGLVALVGLGRRRRRGNL